MRHPWTSRPRTLAAGFAAALTLITTLFGGTTVAQAASAQVNPQTATAQVNPQAEVQAADPQANAQANAAHGAGPAQAGGPCDVYAAGGTPCVAAHSSTRALYASYKGPLYQVTRLDDHAVKNIGVLERGGYADAAAQDRFCAGTTCLVTKLYDQSPMHNDLTQPPRGGFSGPAMGGYDNLPIADMAPVTVDGHKAYGIFIAPGMGLRDNDTRGIAVDDEPEGMYWIVDGQHYNGGCCFDYGNGEIDSRDDDNGTMETSYFGTASAWYHGNPPGPWIMTDQENNLVGCVEAVPGPAEHHLPVRDRGREGRAAPLGLTGRRRAAGRADHDVRRAARGRQLRSDAQAGRHRAGQRR
jgi:hypothetical protein